MTDAVPEPVDELVVVGCGTVVPEGDRGGSAYWVSTGGSHALFDCGPGALQGMARLGLPWEKLTDLVITHFHADHVGSVPGLFFAFMHGLSKPRRGPLDVWGPVGTADFFERVASAYGSFVLEPGFPLRFREVEPGEERTLEGGGRLRTHKTPHTEESLAYRLDRGRIGFGYSGDSGPSDSLGGFFSGVPTLVCECSLFDEQVSDNHLSPKRVASIARAARPSRLILTHIYPHVRLGADVPALVAAAGYDGRTLEASEGLRVALTDG